MKSHLIYGEMNGNNSNKEALWGAPSGMLNDP
jgi:hypothetical protein